MSFAVERTLLVLNGLGVPLYSARGLTQTLAPIEQSRQIFRTVNGALVDYSMAQFQKYTTKVSCVDRKAPRMDAVWPGHLVTMYCVAELSYLTAGGVPSRGVVAGSSYVVGDYTYYRPILNVMLMMPNMTVPEWEADTNWEMEFEEV